MNLPESLRCLGIDYNTLCAIKRFKQSLFYQKQASQYRMRDKRVIMDTREILTIADFFLYKISYLMIIFQRIFLRIAYLRSVIL